jgi:adenosylcobinamide kinase/adenosylcobinamide-phosphate guanylyltransferase
VKVLVTGGVKSGKSTFALKFAEDNFPEKNYLATAVPIDEEMKERIEKHKRERGPEYTTFEEPVFIDKHAKPNLILDCLTVWMNNLFYYKKEESWKEILRNFLNGLGENAVIVSNEISWGNIPADSETRKYNRYLSEANCMIASEFDAVYLMVAGLPHRVK